MPHSDNSVPPAGNAAARTAGRRAWAVRLAAVAVGYCLTSQMFLIFTALPNMASPFWPPAALALWACLSWGLGILPAIWLGAAFGVWLAGPGWLPSALIGVSACLEALAGTWLIRRYYPSRSRFIYEQNVFRFVGIVAACSMVGASVGIAGLALAGAAPGLLAHGWLSWWIGDATGMIVGVPLLLTLRQQQEQQERHERQEWPSGIAEAAAFVLLLPIATVIAFGDSLGRWPLTYLPIPFVIWAAFRFRLAAVTWTTAAICMIAVWNTVHGSGPFASTDMNTSLLLLMLYVAIIGVTGLALANLLHQRDRAEQRLTAERDALEQRVRERTEALRLDIRQRRRVECQLEEAQHLAQIGSWNWDVASGEITWSDELYRIYGVSRDNFTPTPETCRALIHCDDLGRLRNVMHGGSRDGGPFHVEHRILLPSGQTRTLAARGNVQTDGAGRPLRVFGTVQDVTEAKQAEAALREAEERYRMVVELSPDAILVQQDGLIVFANRAAAVLLRADDAGQIVGKRFFDLLDPSCQPQARERMAALEQGQSVPPTEKRMRRLDGSKIDFEVNSSPFLHKGRFAVLYIMHDVTERKKNVAAMAYLAHYDSLTGLPNRALFLQRLAHALSIAQRPGRSLEILFLDLDRFKNINDTLGHAIGDRVLRETATRLQGLLRESDTVARLGGDEFVVLLENVDEPHRGGIVAEKILAAFQPPFLPQGERLAITTSIGISRYPSDGANADALLKSADIAMYRAKEMGRNAYCYYASDMNQHTTERLAIEYALASAIELGQLALHYQPKVDVMSNRIAGMEALLRWEHPTLGTVPPQRFIPIAEEIGLIRQIGYWTIRTACQQNRRWQELWPARLKVAVNLSAHQLADDKLAQNIAQILEETGLAARYLELEITESAIMENPDRAIAVLNMLRDLGITVAIDDFGIGYSSLAHLKRFPIRAVKIDRSFVQGIPASDGDAAITRAIISLAHSLECSVIAEGAETQQQYDFLREHECDSVQGYYFSAPIDAEMFGDLLKVQANLHVH